MFLFLCVGTKTGGQHRVVTFSQASGTFIAVAIINSVPTETSFGWAGQYLSLRGSVMAQTLLLSSYGSLALSAPHLACPPACVSGVSCLHSLRSCAVHLKSYPTEHPLFFFLAQSPIKQPQQQLPLLFNLQNIVILNIIGFGLKLYGAVVKLLFSVFCFHL